MIVYFHYNTPCALDAIESSVYYTFNLIYYIQNIS